MHPISARLNINLKSNVIGPAGDNARVSRAFAETERERRDDKAALLRLRRRSHAPPDADRGAGG